MPKKSLFQYSNSFCLFAFFIMLLSGIASAAQPVDLGTLLEEMADLSRLTTLGKQAYTTGQFSSYDRRSTDPSIATEENWFANTDRNQHLRVEEQSGRKEWVLMDAEGPGAIVRFWSANPTEGGVVRFYLDHASEPVIEMPLASLLEGKTKPFISPICGERGKGWNSYLPIPYEKHCKVTIDASDIYYIINYRTYVSDTEVKSFTLADTEKYNKELRAVSEAFKHPGNFETAPGATVKAFDVTVEGADSEDCSFDGPSAISGIQCKVTADDLEQALRGCLLKISFDGQAPSVVAPLGDFFGTAPGINPYQSLPSGVLADNTLYSRWIMPFKEKAEVELINFNRFPVTLSLHFFITPHAWTDDTLYFHAKWKGVQDIPTRPMQDWNFMSGTGVGRFCGVLLHITNPVTQWWGEGDEKIYVDGDTFPSFFGTGSEDYFGYAWCDTEVFTHAYHNQIRCDGPANFGQSCVSRFHIMDDIPFRKDFRFDMEIWHWADVLISQSITAYWYAAAGATDNFPEPSADLLTVPVYPVPEAVKGALEGEKMRAIEVSRGTVDAQSGSWPWSSFLQLWWRGGEPGDHLKLRFPVAEAGNYEVSAVFTKAPDYGIHELAVNGKVIAPSVDLFNAGEVIVAEPVSLGRADFTKGLNFIDVKILGKHPDSTDYMFGLDYILLTP